MSLPVPPKPGQSGQLAHLAQVYAFVNDAPDVSELAAAAAVGAKVDVDGTVSEAIGNATSALSLGTFAPAADGVTDDVSAIEAWLDAAVAQGAAAVAPKGTYAMSSSVTLTRAHDGLDIDWNGSTIVVPATVPDGVTPLRIFGGRNIAIRNVTILCDAPNRPVVGDVADEALSGSGIRVQVDGDDNRAQDILIENVHVHDPMRYGISLRGCERVRVISCTASGYGDDGFDVGSKCRTEAHKVPARMVSIIGCVAHGGTGATSALSNGFEIDDGAHDVTVSGCIAENDFTAGFDVHGGADLAVHHVTFTGCVARNPGTRGFNVATGSPDTEKHHDIAIVGCTVEGSGIQAALFHNVADSVFANNVCGNLQVELRGQVQNITVEGNHAGQVVLVSSVANQPRDVLVRGNTIMPAAGEGVVASVAEGATVERISIEGNIVRCPSDGIYLRRSVDVTVTGNTVVSSAGAARAIRVLDVDVSARLVITDNQLLCTVTAASDAPAIALAATNSLVANNVVRGPGYGILVSGSDNQIIGNRVYGGAAIGIRIEAGVERCVVVGNRISGASIGFDALGGNYDCVVTGNIVTGSSTAAFRQLAGSGTGYWVFVGNNYRGQTLTLTGAAVGNQVANNIA